MERKRTIMNALKRLLSFIMTFAMVLGMCTWNVGGELIKAEASEASGAKTAATLSNPRKDSNGNVTYDCVWFGRYPQSDATGEKKDAIKWRVLSVDGNDAFLIADCNLDCQKYNTTYESVTWETSTIRSWLNGYNAGYNADGIDYSSDNFIDKAFTSAEKEAINQVTVVNNDNPRYGTEGGNDTKDKVFLLSIEEVLNPDYGFSSSRYEYDNARWRTNTAYAKEQGAWTYNTTDEDYVKYNGNGYWWLRSPGDSTDSAACVGSDGYVYTFSYGVDYINIAVCPALHLNLSSNLWSYAGIVCTDGTVDESGTSKPVAPVTPATLSNPRKDSDGNVTYDCVWFGRYPQSDATGEKKDAIKWRVLSVDGNDAFLIADCNLDCQKYNTTWRSVTWETSTIRSWLNGYNASYNANGIDYSSDNFIDKAFTSAEKEAINQVTVVNNDNPDYETEGGNDTKDKVFLLSIEEVTNPDYGFSSFRYGYNNDDNARWRTNTAYVKEQGADTYSSTNEDYVKYNGNGHWWLRSPGESTNYATIVTYDGFIGYNGSNVGYKYDAVCPALHLNLSSNLWSYAGTVCTDGTVDENGTSKPIATPGDAEPDKPDKPMTPAAPATLSNPRKDSDGNVTYDCVWFGRYPQSDATGEKKDAIKWRVLSVDGNDAFLIADCILDWQTYNTPYESITWEKSTIRSWLNGYNAGYNANGIDYSSDNFIDKAFTSAEQDAINQVMVVNNDNPYGTEGGNNTKDKVFLLSIDEVTNPDYGFSSDSDEEDNARCKKTTTYAKAKGAYADSYTEEYNGNGKWGLRSPGCGADISASVSFTGYVYCGGSDLHDASSDAVCPALHLNLSSNLWSYAGTVCTDGTVDESGASKPVTPVTPTPEPEKPTTPATPKPDKPTTPATPEPDKPTAKTPAAKGTTLNLSGYKLKVKVTSSSKSNPTVAVIGVTDSKTKEISIPATISYDGVTYKVTKIADNAFKGNKKLTTVTMGNNVTSIGKNAFSGCTALAKATIGKNVTTIGDKAFYKCKKLKSITMSAKARVIGSSAFSGCTSLTKATIGKNVTSIGDKAFYKCTKLASITILDKVKKIGNSTFYGCTSLKKATIGKRVTSIGKNAFYGCKKLKTITIKSSKVKTIGKNAFKSINKKATITLKGTKKANKALKKKLKKSSVGYVKTWKIK